MSSRQGAATTTNATGRAIRRGWVAILALALLGLPGLVTTPAGAAAKFRTVNVPTIVGTNLGTRLTARPGASSPKATSYSYQWLRNGTKIAGATRSTYTLTKADNGKRIRVWVAYRRAGYTPVGKTSAYTPVINYPVSRILADTNAYRASHGTSAASKRALKISNAINRVAASWAKTMHNTCRFRHNPNFARQIPRGWTRAGENVAAGQGYTNVVRAWINSAPHRANLLGDYTHIGIGYYSGPKCLKRYYVQNFAKY